uniref:Uncharacterized protein n=1 Tax=Callorhinchus milii TaxID=7868 RepID=A0A4W3H3D9_CALMI
MPDAQFTGIVLPVRFILLPGKRHLPKLQSLFTVQPQKGTLSPADRPVHIHVAFSGNTTVDIKDQPYLRCQVIEPSLPKGEQVIANIPIKLSARSIFCLYTISPAKEVNFGTLLVGNRRTRTFILENNCDFEFKYTILKTAWDMPMQQQKRSAPRHQHANSVVMRLCVFVRLCKTVCMRRFMCVSMELCVTECVNECVRDTVCVCILWGCVTVCVCVTVGVRVLHC